MKTGIVSFIPSAIEKNSSWIPAGLEYDDVPKDKSSGSMDDMDPRPDVEVERSQGEPDENNVLAGLRSGSE